MPSPSDRGSGRSGEDHYDSNQPRVPAGDPSNHGGRWTSEGGAATAVGVAPAIGIDGAGALAPEALALFRQALARLASVGAMGPIGALAGLLIPTNRSHITAGVVPGQRDLRWHNDEGVLTIGQNLPNGDTKVLFLGLPDPDGIYRTPDGEAIAQYLPDGVMLNEAGIRKARTRAATRTDAVVVAKDKVKYCPDPVPDNPSNDGIRWQLYQMRISRLPRGIAVELNGVMFDGCDETRHVMLEAKGEGFAWALDGDDFFEGYRGKARLIRQMQRQFEAANGRIVEWHVAEAKVAAVLQKFAIDNELHNIVVIHTPPMFDHGGLK